MSSELFVEPNQNTNFLFVPNYRYDHFDKERSLFDISQGYILYFNKRSELKIGKEKITYQIDKLEEQEELRLPTPTPEQEPEPEPEPAPEPEPEPEPEKQQEAEQVKTPKKRGRKPKNKEVSAK